MAHVREKAPWSQGGTLDCIGDNITRILEPYLGHIVADTCVRATALSIGKTYDALSLEDLPALENNIQRILAPVTSHARVQAIIAEIQQEVA